MSFENRFNFFLDSSIFEREFIGYDLVLRSCDGAHSMQNLTQIPKMYKFMGINQRSFWDIYSFLNHGIFVAFAHHHALKVSINC